MATPTRMGLAMRPPRLDRGGCVATLTSIWVVAATLPSLKVARQPLFFFFFLNNKLALTSSKAKHLFCQKISTTREEYRFIKKCFAFRGVFCVVC
jgi:hypothetical protein